MILQHHVSITIYSNENCAQVWLISARLQNVVLIKLFNINNESSGQVFFKVHTAAALMEELQGTRPISSYVFEYCLHNKVFSANLPSNKSELKSF